MLKEKYSKLSKFADAFDPRNIQLDAQMIESVREESPEYRQQVTDWVSQQDDLHKPLTPIGRTRFGREITPQDRVKQISTAELLGNPRPTRVRGLCID